MNWKKIAFGALNIALAAYLVLAMVAFNKPDDSLVCRNLHITIENGVVEGFLSSSDIKSMLNEDGISLVGQSMEEINLRVMESILESKELIEKAECYKGQNGLVCIDVRQRIPVARVMRCPVPTIRAISSLLQAQSPKPMPRNGSLPCPILCWQTHSGKTRWCSIMCLATAR